jgi:hypothetical protein
MPAVELLGRDSNDQLLQTIRPNVAGSGSLLTGLLALPCLVLFELDLLPGRMPRILTG